MPVPLIAVRTVILVRHAEVNSGINPALSPPGQQRAILLARMLRDINLKAVFVTEFQRSVQTGTPAADMAGLTVTPYSHGDPAGLVATVNTAHKKGTVLVIAHSDTVDDIAAGFNASGAGTLASGQFDRMFLIIRSLGTTLTRLRYGASTP